MPKKPTDGRPSEASPGRNRRAPPQPGALVGEFVARLGSRSPEIAQDVEALAGALVETLRALLMDDNGGDPLARRARAAVYAEFDRALNATALHPAALLLAAKVFSDSGWAVPESLKRRLLERLDDPEMREVGGDLEATLADIAEASEGDPFAAFDALKSVLSAFPSGSAAAMVGALAEGSAPVLRHVLAGFAMDRDPPLAFAAIEALKRVARAERVESALLERLVRMRPWLPSDRQAPLDEAIRAMRAHALAPVETERPEQARCFAIACDATGSAGLLAGAKAPEGWRFAAAMTKPTGVEEAISVEGLSRREADAAVRGMRETVTAARTDVEGLAQCLALALGENLASGAPPPFRLVAFVESLGLGPIAPRALSPEALIENLLSQLPASQTSAQAVQLARRMRFDDVLAQPWFEAGGDVERLLAPLRSGKERERAVMREILPARRAFWTRACALTAFTLGLEPKTFGAAARSLALIGRDLADGVALDEIGLMRDIAAVSVEAFESRGGPRD